VDQVVSGAPSLLVWVAIVHLATPIIIAVFFIFLACKTNIFADFYDVNGSFRITLRVSVFTAWA